MDPYHYAVEEGFVMVEAIATIVGFTFGLSMLLVMAIGFGAEFRPFGFWKRRN